MIKTYICKRCGEGVNNQCKIVVESDIDTVKPTACPWVYKIGNTKETSGITWCKWKEIKSK